MTTGVDAQTCKLIVLDQHIKSMTEFKQIIGRGTRINEDYGKYWFTIMDFKKATELFADKDFDGDPVMIYEPKGDESPVPPDETGGGENGELGGEQSNEGEPPQFTGQGGGGEPRIKYVIGDVNVYVVAERVQYYGSDGKLITESLKDYTRHTVRKDFSSLDEFLRRWKQADRKAAIINELQEHGVLLEPLAEEVGKDFDAFDLICHVAFDQPPLTRRERAENVKKRNYFTRYGEQARRVLESLLEKYADTGIENIEDIKILTIDPFKTMGTPNELVKAFGGKDAYLKAIHELEQQLYGHH
jgi:type I restriction enzyme R subunit